MSFSHSLNVRELKDSLGEGRSEGLEEAGRAGREGHLISSFLILVIVFVSVLYRLPCKYRLFLIVFVYVDIDTKCFRAYLKTRYMKHLVALRSVLCTDYPKFRASMFLLIFNE